MWTEEELDFDTELDKVVEKYLVSIRVQVAELLKLAIYKAVYQFYTPNTYQRLYQLYNQVKFDVTRSGKNTVLFVYVDTSKMVYESAVSGNIVTEAVPWFVEEGHQAHNYTPHPSVANNQFHHYSPPRHYLELAKTLIEEQLGIEVQIIKDAPPLMY